jgi:hypothetical protein
MRGPVRGARCSRRRAVFVEGETARWESEDHVAKGRLCLVKSSHFLPFRRRPERSNVVQYQMGPSTLALTCFSHSAHRLSPTTHSRNIRAAADWKLCLGRTAHRGNPAPSHSGRRRTSSPLAWRGAPIHCGTMMGPT